MPSKGACTALLGEWIFLIRVRSLCAQQRSMHCTARGMDFSDQSKVLMCPAKKHALLGESGGISHNFFFFFLLQVLFLSIVVASWFELADKITCEVWTFKMLSLQICCIRWLCNKNLEKFIHTFLTGPCEGGTTVFFNITPPKTVRFFLQD